LPTEASLAEARPGPANSPRWQHTYSPRRRRRGRSSVSRPRKWWPLSHRRCSAAAQTSVPSKPAGTPVAPGGQRHARGLPAHQRARRWPRPDPRYQHQDDSADAPV